MMHILLNKLLFLYVCINGPVIFCHCKGAARGKLVAAICHGAQMLISVNALRGRTVTCWPSIAIDVKNAGGRYVDRPVVEDGNVITSRRPDDSPVFSEALVRALTKAPDVQP